MADGLRGSLDLDRSGMSDGPKAAPRPTLATLDDDRIAPDSPATGRAAPDHQHDVQQAVHDDERGVYRAADPEAQESGTT